MKSTREFLRSYNLRIILIGIVIRLIIAPFTLNWDFLALSQLTGVLEKGSLNELFMDHRVAYPLPFYLLNWSYLTLIRPLLSGDFRSFLTSGDLAAISSPFLFRYLFFLKLPMVAAEIGAAYFLSVLFPNNKRGSLLLFWLLSPLALYLVPAFTNIDALPVFLTILHYFFLQKKKIYLSSFFLSLAASFKFYPVLMLPFFLLSISKRKARIISFLVFIIPFLLWQLPALFILEYRKFILLGGNVKLILQTALNLSGLSIPLYPLIYLFLLLIFKKQNKNFLNYFLFSSYSLVFIFFLGQYHLQWILWIMPFLVYSFVNLKKGLSIAILFHLIFFSFVSLHQFSLNFGMLAPLNPTFWQYDWPQKEFLGEKISPVMNSLQIMVSFLLIYMVYMTYKDKTQNEKLN